MSYKINPVKAAIKAYKDKNCDIINLNKACFSVCAAFKGSDNNWAISPQCADECNSLVNDMRKSTYGLGWCGHHAPNRPVFWNQAGHFFPAYFNKYQNVPKALAACNQKCEKGRYPNQCKDNCLLDSYAVELIPANSQVPTREEFDDNNDNDSNNVDYSKYEKAHPVAFWFGLSVAVLFFIVFIIILIKFLMK